MALERIEILITQKGARIVKNAIKGIGSSAVTAGIQVAKFTTIAAALGAGFAIKQAADFESSMLSVAKTTGIVGEELKALSDDFIELTKSVPSSAEELANIGAIAGQLGIQARSDIVIFTDTVAKMAAVTDLSAESAATSLAELSNVFKLPIGEAAKLGSALNEVANTTTASAEVLVNFSQRIGVVGRQVGLSAADVIGLSGTLKGLGFNAELAGTAVSKTFIQLITNTETFAEQSGVSVKEFRKNLERDAIGTVIKWAESINELPKEELINALDEAGVKGARALPVFLALSGATADLAKNVGTSNKAFKEATSLQDEFNIQIGSTANQAKLLGNVINALFIDLGTDLLPTVKLMIQALKEVANSDEAIIFFENLKLSANDMSESFKQDGGSFIQTLKFMATAATAFVNILKVGFVLAGTVFNGIIKLVLQVERGYEKATLAFQKFAKLFQADSAKLDAAIRKTESNIVGLDSEIGGLDKSISNGLQSIVDMSASFDTMSAKVRAGTDDQKKLSRDTQSVADSFDKANDKSKKFSEELPGKADIEGLADALKSMADETARLSIASESAREFSDIINGISEQNDGVGLDPESLEKLRNGFQKLTDAKTLNGLREIKKSLNEEFVDLSTTEPALVRLNQLLRGLGDVDLTPKGKQDLLDLIKRNDDLRKSVEDRNEAFKQAGEIAKDQARIQNGLTREEAALGDELQRLADISEATGGKLFNLALAQEAVVMKFGETSTDVAKKTQGDVQEVLDAIGKGTEDVLTDILSTGTFTLDSLNSVVESVTQDIIRSFVRAQIESVKTSALSQGGKGGGGFGGLIQAGLGFFGFAEGGSARVGGSGGTDSTLVSFFATPGEDVTVRTPAQQVGASIPRFGGGGNFAVGDNGGNNGGTTVINAQTTIITKDQDSFRKSRAQIASGKQKQLSRAGKFN